MSRSQSEEAALSGIKTQFTLFHSLHLLYKVSNRVNKHRKSLVVALDDFFFQANTPNVSSVEPLKCEIFLLFPEGYAEEACWLHFDRYYNCDQS